MVSIRSEYAGLQGFAAMLSDTNHRGRLQGIDIASGIHSQLIITKRVKLRACEEARTDGNNRSARSAGPLLCLAIERRSKDGNCDRDISQTAPTSHHGSPGLSSGPTTAAS